MFEIVDNSVDEALAGHCSEITVTLLEGGAVQVQDNGRGIPCSIHPSTGKSSLETVLCVLHAGGKFGGADSGYKVSGGLHGVGLSVVNALSDTLDVAVVREGKHHSMSFSCGIPTSEMVVRPALPSESKGTTVLFKPDGTIFKTTLHFDFDKLADRMDELAYLNAGLLLRMVDKRCKASRNKGVTVVDSEQEDSSDAPAAAIIKPVGKAPAIVLPDQTETTEKEEVKVVEFCHQGGIKELVSALCESKTNLHPEKDIIVVEAQELKGVVVEAALCWSKDQYNDALSGFANGIRTIDGGTHLDGLKAAVTRTVNAFAKKTGKIKDSNIPGDFVREGLTAVISVKVGRCYDIRLHTMCYWFFIGSRARV